MLGPSDRLIDYRIALIEIDHAQNLINVEREKLVLVHLPNLPTPWISCLDRAYLLLC